MCEIKVIEATTIVPAMSATSDVTCTGHACAGTKHGKTIPCAKKLFYNASNTMQRIMRPTEYCERLQVRSAEQTMSHILRL